MYFHEGYCGMDPKADLFSSTSASICLGPVCAPDEALCNILFQPVLPLMLVRKLDCDRFGYAYIGFIQSFPICRMGSCSMS
jgi:hypothetical protein